MSEKKVVIAPVGDYMEALFTGIREFPTERIILVAPPGTEKTTQETIKDLEKFGIPYEVKKLQVEDDKISIWEAMFQTVSEIKKLEKNHEVIINVATGNRETRCAATSAAFVNGMKAFATDGNKAMLLPVLKFSYYKMLTDKKMEILNFLYREGSDCCASLEQLSKKTGMSLPLVSYHVNGNLKSEGLKDLGLVETAESKGKVAVKLTILAKLLVKGYISPPPINA